MDAPCLLGRRRFIARDPHAGSGGDRGDCPLAGGLQLLVYDERAAATLIVQVPSGSPRKGQNLEI
jgi:hypothetical protein